MLARAAVAALAALLLPRLAVAAEDPLASPATAAPVSAPAAARDEGSAGRRVLNGHVFMPSTTVPGALTTTSFASYLVLAYGQSSANFQVVDRTYSGSFDYAGIGSILGYEYAFQRYFSARFTLDNVIYSGIDGPSAIVVGTSLQFGGSLGLTASLPVGDSLRVGVLFDAGITPGLGLTIANGIRSIVRDCQAGNCSTGQGDIFGIHKATTLQPALAVNWSPWRPLGVTANTALVHVSQKDGDETFTADAASLGAAADLDLLPLWNVPVGLQLAFSWTAPFSGDVLQHVTDMGGGVFYTGRRNLALGMQFVSRRFAVQPTVDVSWSTVITTVGLRYYW